MNVAVGIASRIGPQDNPLLKRCMESLQKVDAGMPFEFRLELGHFFTRGEKRQRVFAYAKQRNFKYVCILEDDTVILQPGWLYSMIATFVADPTVGMLNPLETKDGTFPGGPENVRGIVSEGVKMYGFCIVYAMDWDPMYDPKVTHLDDLGMSLLCRSKGRRLAICGHTTLQHTKEPFLSDKTPPWEQGDRERWGDDSVYYNQDKHFEARLIESQYLIDRFGDMATTSLPEELVEELKGRAKLKAAMNRPEMPLPAFKEPG